MLQERLNELGSAILNIKNRKVHITGFTREEMLQSYLHKGAKNWSSIGLYDLHDEEDLEFLDIRDDALIIVQKNGNEIGRHQYKHEAKQTIEFKDEEGKMISRTFRIRKSVYSDHYHFYLVAAKDEESSESFGRKQSLLFDGKNALDCFLAEEYGINL
ncbi:hypothetical protein EPH95_05350 [Salicibibacter halophilus]|uniref:Uncharacterized protein n=1 Tax=Salicibibacter halophilus TaxID=2502791 RepID=A0A514LGK8_9BACI|nr:hypothetical protein [Salicibibacter halophilus]QDI90675.1 hypothetical protein EPH95_05350 [Salicibibacter halophilus]